AEAGIVSARATVLARIRRSLGVTGNESERNATVDDRLGRAPKGVVPARGQLPPAERLALFAAMAAKVAATVQRVAATDEVPAAVADYLRSHNLPAALRIGDDALIAGLPWEKTQIAVSRGAADADDAVGLSHAFAGVAESGTLMLASGRDNPTTLNFLPETHVVVLGADDVVGDYETAWERLRAVAGKGQMPRTVNMVTGPSHSGDIEQTILLGAHGPRRLHIIVIG
ncbi:MAG: lactate utilization protein, partial [Bauldia sp.]